MDYLKEIFMGVLGALSVNTVVAFIIKLFPNSIELVFKKQIDELFSKRMIDYQNKLDQETYVGKDTYNRKMNKYDELTSIIAALKQKCNEFFFTYNLLNHKLLDEEKNIDYYKKLYSEIIDLIDEGEKCIYKCEIYIGNDSIELSKKIVHNSKDLGNFIKEIIFDYQCNLQDSTCNSIFLQAAHYIDYINKGYALLTNQLRKEINNLKIKN